jgi:hypothetical protein
MTGEQKTRETTAAAQAVGEAFNIHGVAGL